jgi:hypothetical protein
VSAPPRGRRILRAAGWLAAGAALSYASAWAPLCADAAWGRGRPAVGGTVGRADPADWTWTPGLPPPAAVFVVPGPGGSEEWLAVWDPPAAGAEALLAGWPARCACLARGRIDPSAAGPGARGAWRVAGALGPSGDPLDLPLRPIWPGLLADAAAWGAAAWGLSRPPGALRARARRRRGGCPECGYSRSGLPGRAVCPECGAR